MTASSPPRPKQIATWPGVWPGVGMRRTWSPDRVVVAHELGPSASMTGSTLSPKAGSGVLACSAGPMVVFASRRRRSGPSGRSAPSGRSRAGVPADMIGVQMRAHHEVDVVDREPRGSEAAHIGVVGLQMPVRPRRPSACRCRCSYPPGWCGAACAPHRTGSTRSACPAASSALGASQWRFSAAARASGRAASRAPAGKRFPARRCGGW